MSLFNAIECRSEGKSDEFIKSKRTFHRRNKRVKGPKAENEEAGIIWAADDPVLHQFRARRRDAEGNEVEGEARTVCDYYDMRYDIQLQFPKMPLVRISDIERFPVEFLRQGKLSINTIHSQSLFDLMPLICQLFVGLKLLRKLGMRILMTRRSMFLRLTTNMLAPTGFLI